MSEPGSPRPGTLRRGLRPSLLLSLLPLWVGCGEGDVPPPGGPLVTHDLDGLGLAHPAAVIVDTIADVYLVSNINGTEGLTDGNGFISSISPDGEAINARWIDAAATSLPMNSPRGLALLGDSLIVSDQSCLRIFSRLDGTDLGYSCLDGIGYITDVDVGPEGSVFITAGGYEVTDEGLEPSGTDAVYRIILSDQSRGSTLARSPDLGHPSGIAVGRRGIFVTTEGSGEIFRLTPGGERTNVFSPSERELRGIVFLPDGGFIFTSRGEQAVYLVSDAGLVNRIAEGLPDPGAPGFDPARNRVIVPLRSDNRLIFIDLP